MLYIFSCSFVDVQFGCSVISAMSDRSYRPPASDHMTDPNFASTLIVVPSTRVLADSWPLKLAETSLVLEE
jgi:hypothetical protein